MSTESARKVISRAVMDEEFRNLLFSNPDQALSGYDLTEEEQLALRGIPAETIDDFSSKLEERISMSIVAYGAEAFGGQAFSGEAMTGSAYSGEAMSGEAMSGAAYSGEAMSGEAMSGAAFSGEAMTGEAMTGEAMTGEAMTGEAMTGEAMTGEAFGGESAGENASWLVRLANALGLGRSGGGAGKHNFY